MKNKKGFTLIEILGIIALLAIIMLLFLPNVSRLFSLGKKNLFYNNVISIFNSVTSTYLNNVAVDNNYKTRFCKGLDTSFNLLNIDTELYYDVSVDTHGRVISFKVASDDYMFNAARLAGKSYFEKNDLSKDTISDNTNGLYCNITTDATCVLNNDDSSCSVFELSYDYPGENA